MRPATNAKMFESTCLLPTRGSLSVRPWIAIIHTSLHQRWLENINIIIRHRIQKASNLDHVLVGCTHHHLQITESYVRLGSKPSRASPITPMDYHHPPPLVSRPHTHLREHALAASVLSRRPPAPHRPPRIPSECPSPLPHHLP